MWEFWGKGSEKVDYAEFFPDIPDIPEKSSIHVRKQSCCAAVMLDTPVDKVAVSENTFINFISRAEKSVYITTPYFMCSGELLSALYTAARSGVDVRIVTPFIADKRLVKVVTKSYYRGLIENGVRIFEYIGFIHAKNISSDGKRAMISTVNLDYRSLYLHYECGVCFFGSAGEESIIGDIDRDFDDTLRKSREVTTADLDKESLFMRGIQRVCRLLAPFL
ncbi:MAG: phospholipase D-like domain-containing protein, partial [Oscillospiraceae bacterium]|nr:phospholipase D-like domain-containing protein [Oscillospiraceae bacterium]